MRWLAVLLLGGCVVGHSRVNAPGHVDLTTPPAATVAVGEAEVPGDPGERVFGGALLAWGTRAVDSDRSWRGQLGVELQLLYAENGHSHNDDAFGAYPINGVGAFLGWTYYDGEATAGPLYLEAALPASPELPGRLGLGVAWDPDDARVGPQLTVSLLGAFVRGQLLFGEAGERLWGFSFGMALGVPMSWTRSR